jgi:hypothetical protein
MHSIFQRVFATEHVDSLVVAHRPVHTPTVIDQSLEYLLFRAYLWLINHVGETLRLAPAYAMFRMAHFASLVLLQALEPEETAAFKETRVIVQCLIETILDTTIPAAVSSIPITLFPIVLSVTGTVA